MPGFKIICIHALYDTALFALARSLAALRTSFPDTEHAGREARAARPCTPARRHGEGRLRGGEPGQDGALWAPHRRRTDRRRRPPVLWFRLGVLRLDEEPAQVAAEHDPVENDGHVGRAHDGLFDTPRGHFGSAQDGPRDASNWRVGVRQGERGDDGSWAGFPEHHAFPLVQQHRARPVGEQAAREHRRRHDAGLAERGDR